MVASSSEEMRLVELFEIQSQEGPCPDCFRTGQPTLNVDLATGEVPWALFGPVALKAGFRSVHALPMRLRVTDVDRDSTIFDVKVREVAKRLDISEAQVREVFAACDAISLEWAHTDEEATRSTPR